LPRQIGRFAAARPFAAGVEAADDGRARTHRTVAARTALWAGVRLCLVAFARFKKNGPTSVGP
jgi:hypothetical protein